MDNDPRVVGMIAGSLGLERYDDAKTNADFHASAA